MKLLYLFVCAGLLLGAPGCKKENQSAAEAANADVPVAVVGDMVISRRMVELRAETITGPTRTTDPKVSAFAQMIQASLAAIVANRYGDLVSDASVKKFYQEIEPHFSADVRALAEKIGDEKLRYVVLAFPDYAIIALEDFFHNGEPFERAASNAMWFHRTASKEPESLDQLAERQQLKVERLWIGPGTLRSAAVKAVGRVALDAGDAVQPFSDEERQQAAELYEKLRTTKPGKIYARPFETPDGFQVFRVEERRGNEMLVALVTLPKPDLDNWFWMQASNIPVELLDRDLGKAFLMMVPWARSLDIERKNYPEFFVAPREN